MRWKVYGAGAALLAVAGASVQITALVVPWLVVVGAALLGAAAGMLILMANAIPLDD